MLDCPRYRRFHFDTALACVGLAVVLGVFAAAKPLRAAAPSAAIFSSAGVAVQPLLNISAGSSVATGDVDGDGVAEIVVGNPPGTSGRVTVYSQDGVMIRSFPVFSQTLKAGISVAVGDVTGGPDIEIVVAARRGVGPHVIIYSAIGRQLSPGFYAYAKTFLGGVNLAIGDVNGDGRDDIITAPLPGGGPHVSFFNDSGTRLGNLFPYEAEFRGGLSVAAFDYDGDGRDDIVTTPLSKRYSDVRIHDAFSRVRLQEFRAFGGFTGGSSVAVNALGGTPKLLLAAGAGGGPQVLQYDPVTGAIDGVNTFPFTQTWRGGVTASPVALTSDGAMNFVASPGSLALSADQLAAYATTVFSSYVRRTVSTAVGSFTASIVHIDLTNPKLRVRTLTGTLSDCSDNCTVQPLGTYVGLVNGFAGVNGSYFCPRDYAACASQDGSYYWMWFNSLSATFVNASQNKFNTSGGLVAFDTLNRAYAYQVASTWPGKPAFESQYGVHLRALLSNGPTLVYNRTIVVTAGQLDDKQRTVKGNRSGIGLKGSSVYLVVASSATVLDLGYIMRALGMDFALNLDGGGSSALYYNGSYRVGPGRNIPNAVVFTER